jgi:hypothetical protein
LGMLLTLRQVWMHHCIHINNNPDRFFLALQN